MSCKLKLKDKGVVILPNGKESLLFNSIYNIVEDYQQALDIYQVVDTKEFKDFNKGHIAQYRADKSVLKNAVESRVRGFSEVHNSNQTVRIVYKEGNNNVDLELIESKELGKGHARKFLQDFIYSFPNKDISLIISPRDRGTTFQGLASFYESMGFEYKRGSDVEMIRFKNKGRLYPEGYDENAEPSVGTLMSFIRNNTANKATKKEVIDFLTSKGIQNTDRLLENLLQMSNQGILIFSKDKMKKATIFDDFEIYKIQKDPSKQNGLQEVFNYLLTEEYVEVGTSEKVASGEVLNSGVVEKKGVKADTNKSVLVDGVIQDKLQQSSNVKTSETLTDEANPELSSDIAFLRNISEDVWADSIEEVTTLLESVEEEALQNGVNIKGLSTKAEELGREGVLNILEQIEYAIETLDSSQLQTTIDTTIGDTVESTNISLKDGEIFLETSLSEESLFENEGLLKVDDNIYIKVPDVSLEELLSSVSDKTGMPISIVAESATKETDGYETSQKIYLHKVARGVNEKVVNVKVDKITSQDVSNYYRDDFIKDFGDWLNENDNTDFTVNEKGISFSNPYQRRESYERLPNYLKESLQEYSKVSETFDLDFIFNRVNADFGDIYVDRARVMANKNALKEFAGEYNIFQEYIVTKNSVDNFIKVNNTVFELVSEDGNIGYYKRVEEQEQMANSVLKPEATNDILSINHSKTEAKEIEDIQNITEKELLTIEKQNFDCA